MSISCPYPPSLSEIPALCLKGQNLSVPYLVFSSVDSTAAVMRVLAQLAGWLHLEGIRILLYLNDWLVLARSLEEALRARQVVLDLAYDLGILVNFS